MLWLYEKKSVSLPRQTKATATASEQTKTFDLQSTGANRKLWLCFRVNKNQSYRGRLTTRISRILLTRQLGTVVRQKTDNRNQQSTIYLNGNVYKGTYRRNNEGDYHCTERQVRAMVRDSFEEGNDGLMMHHYTMDDIDLDSLHRYRNHCCMERNQLGRAYAGK